MIASKRFSFILTTLLLAQSVVTSPVPNNGTTSELVLDLFESLTGVVTKAGDLITKIADMADADQIKERGEEVFIMIRKQELFEMLFRSAALVTSLMMMLPRQSLMDFRKFWVSVTFY